MIGMDTATTVAGVEAEQVERAIALAERMLTESLASASRAERRQLRMLGRLIEDDWNP